MFGPPRLHKATWYIGRLVYAIFCKLCVLLLVFGLSCLERTPCKYYVYNIMYLRLLLSSHLFRWNPDYVYIDYVSGAFNANLFLYIMCQLSPNVIFCMMYIT